MHMSCPLVDVKNGGVVFFFSVCNFGDKTAAENGWKTVTETLKTGKKRQLRTGGKRWPQGKKHPVFGQGTSMLVKAGQSN